MRFRWHPAARLVDVAGGVLEAAHPSPLPVCLDPRPAAAALQAAVGAPAFRIGGTGPAPLGEGLFETLSGGTTGTPKRILRRQASWTASFRVNASLFDIGPGVRVAVLGNLVHSLALYGAVEALHLGAELHLLDGLRPDRQARALADRQIALIYATPAQLRGLCAAGVDWPHLARIVVGGSKLDAGLRQALAVRTPARITEFYGAAETSFISLSDETTPEGSVGRPYPGVDIAVVAGQIRVRSPYLAEVPRDAEGRVAPGEAGRLEGGFLWLDGRIGRQVKVADQTVQPERIEDWLLVQAGVRQAAVIALPDPRRGHVLEACLQGDATRGPALLAGLRATFGPLLAPRRLHWPAVWPALPSGKTDLAALMRQFGGRDG